MRRDGKFKPYGPGINVRDPNLKRRPLLAFALRELYERYGHDALLTIDEYQKLGGLAQSVARVCEFTVQSLPETTNVDVRSAFLGLVRINEQGEYLPGAARWSDLTKSLHPLLERLVRSRVLVVAFRV